MFLCAFAVQTRAGGDSIESSKGCSPPPNQNCKRTENEIKSVRPKFARSPLTVNRIESPEPNPSRQPSVAMYRRKTVESAKGICDD